MSAIATVKAVQTFYDLARIQVEHDCALAAYPLP
jgi:hypothetical protein